MRIDVVGKNLEISDTIRERAEAKGEKLRTYYDHIQQVTVTITVDEKHQRREFDVEFVVDVEHHDDFIAHAKGDDLYQAIDQCEQKLARQLTDHKEKLRTNKR